MDPTMLERVSLFVHETTKKPLVNIKPETSLYFDLDLNLGSAPAFLERFAAAFEVDLKGMNLRPHFEPDVLERGPQGLGGLWEGMLNMFGLSGVDRHKRNGIKPLLVSDLVKMAHLKQWCL